MRLRDEGLPLPAAAVVLSPWTDLALTGQSLTEYGSSDPMVPVELMPKAVELYLAGADPRSPTPLHFMAIRRACGKTHFCRQRCGTAR